MSQPLIPVTLRCMGGLFTSHEGVRPAMLDSPWVYIPVAASAAGILASAGTFISYLRQTRREVAHRHWTARQEARLTAGGPRFKLQVLREDREALEWALAQGRLRVTKNTTWGWYVVAETRVQPRSQ